MTVCVFVALPAPVSALAQHPVVATGPRMARVMLPARPPQMRQEVGSVQLAVVGADSVRARRPTYTWEGATIGAALVGTASAVLVGGLCGYSESRDSCVGSYVGGALTGAFVGGIIGGLIGGNIPKGPAVVPSNERSKVTSADR